MRTVELPDGGRLQLRPVRPADKPRFLAAYEHLGPESRYRRFLVPHGDLTPAELRYFTEVDHYDHEAIVALDAETGDGVGVARYVRDPRRFDTAELAVTVVDDWQGRGLGTELLAQLSDRARQAGISRFTATTGYGNAAMARLLQNMGAELTGYGPGTVDYEFALDRAGEYSLDWWFRCVDDDPVLNSR